MAQSLPAQLGAPADEIDTPSLLVDLDALERNIVTMSDFVRAAGVRLRAHAKTHKSPDIAKLQIDHGAVGVCCQKVSEAEAMVQGGVGDVLVSNQVVGARKLERLAALARKAQVKVCVDDAGNVAELDEVARRFDTVLEVLVEIDVGAGRCGVAPGPAAVELARQVAASGHLSFGGLQAYQGRAQHLYDFTERRRAIDKAVEMTRDTVDRLRAARLECRIVGGAGTGTYALEAASGVYNELQCGSYVFMDADYGRVRMADGRPMDGFENSLFVYTTIMSKTRPHTAICDAGLKAHSVDSGFPVVYGRDDLEFTKASDEHGVIDDSRGTLKLGDKLRLVPGHCDPTVNLHDVLVGIRKGQVETLWPVAARGMLL